MAHRETISEYEHCRERLNRLCKMNQFTDNFLRSQVGELLTALESVCRPAVVVDGQHRLLGAAEAETEHEIWLPVVAIPGATWMEQIYQFVVINEKSQKVNDSLLTDIFGSSLTRPEQTKLRDRLSRAKVDVEDRIAAVIANRDPESPFRDMIKLKISGAQPEGINPFITDKTIRLLIEGGTARNVRGWRADDDFYTKYVKPICSDRAEWENYSDGKWREYWFAFWRKVGDYYNAQAMKHHDRRLWMKDAQTNLTKAVSLRLFQTFFMELAIGRIEDVEKSREVLEDVLGKAEADVKISEKIKEHAIPESVEVFCDDIEEWFLQYFPVRFFAMRWKTSLDDAQGQQDLLDEMRKAYDGTKSPDKRYRVSTTIFALDDS